MEWGRRHAFTSEAVCRSDGLLGYTLTQGVNSRAEFENWRILGGFPDNKRKSGRTPFSVAPEKKGYGPLFEPEQVSNPLTFARRCARDWSEKGDQPVKRAAASRIARPTPAARPNDLTTRPPSIAEAAALIFGWFVIAISIQR